MRVTATGSVVYIHTVTRVSLIDQSSTTVCRHLPRDEHIITTVHLWENHVHFKVEDHRQLTTIRAHGPQNFIQVCEMAHLPD